MQLQVDRLAARQLLFFKAGAARSTGMLVPTRPHAAADSVAGKLVHGLAAHQAAQAAAQTTSTTAAVAPASSRVLCCSSRHLGRLFLAGDIFCFILQVRFPFLLTIRATAGVAARQQRRRVHCR